MTRFSGCRSLLQCLLKFLNFWLALVGAAMILYSLWMLNKWHHMRPPGLAPVPSEDSSMVMTSVHVGAALHLDMNNHLSEFQQENLLGLDTSGGRSDLKTWKLPAPWFIYCFMGIGIVVCLITCSGHIAVETSNGCCLSCYTVFVGLLILLQAAFAADIFLNKHWEEDFPNDPTGQFYAIENFVEENLDICKWVGLTVVIIEALAVLLAMCLRALVPNSRQTGYNSDDEYVLPRSSTRQPLLNRQGTQGTAPSAGAAEPWTSRPDAWSNRMREKYGLDNKEFSNDTTPQTGMASNENKSRCTIM